MTTLEVSDNFRVEASRKVLPDGELKKFLARVAYYGEQAMQSDISTYVAGHMSLEDEFQPGFVPIQNLVSIPAVDVYKPDRLRLTHLREPIAPEDSRTFLDLFLGQISLSPEQSGGWSGQSRQPLEPTNVRYQLAADQVVTSAYQPTGIRGEEFSLLITPEGRNEILFQSLEQLEQAIKKSDIRTHYPDFGTRPEVQIPILRLPFRTRASERSALLDRINDLILLPHGVKLSVDRMHWSLKD